MKRQIPLIVLSIGAMAAAVCLSGCPQSNTSSQQKGESMPAKTIQQVLNEKTDEWMALPGVAGVAIGESKGKPCIRIFTSRKPDELHSKIPSTVDGYPVIVEHTGAIRALEQ